MADEPGIPSIMELPSRIPSVRAAELAAIRESRAPQAGDAAAGPRIRITQSGDWTGINPVPRARVLESYLVCESCGMARGQNPWCDGCREWELFPNTPGCVVEASGEQLRRAMENAAKFKISQALRELDFADENHRRLGNDSSFAILNEAIVRATCLEQTITALESRRESDEEL